MDIDILIVLAIIVGSLIAFSLELVRSDLVAILIMCLLIATGVLTASEATRGFSSPATLTVACMFIISAAFVRAGLVEISARVLSRWEKPNSTIALLALMIVVGFVSAFINNTAAVAVLIPIAIKLAKISGSNRKAFLMPLSFAAIFGGTCTLIGTSTNILVNSMYVDRGFAGFSMFEFAGIGLILMGVGIVYMMTVGRYLLKSGEVAEMSSKPHEYMTAVKLLSNSPSVGQSLSCSPFYDDFQENIISLDREGKDISLSQNPVLEAGDRFILVCRLDKIMALRNRIGVGILQDSFGEQDVPKDLEIFEVVVPSNSELVGRPLSRSGIVKTKGIIPLAIRHRQRTLFTFLRGPRIQAGDVLIVAGKPAQFEGFRGDESLLLISQIKRGEVNWFRMAVTASLVAAMILTATFGLSNVLSAALVVCALLLLTRTISLQEAYDSLDSQVLTLLACILSLGLALEKSGGASLIADFFVRHAGAYGPYLIISGFYLLTSLLTEVMSNNATAALMTPIALNVAAATQLGEKPFLIAVMLAGSASFMTPVGYQTNTLVFAPGGYKFSDFLKVGTPLNILCWLIATFLIPRFFPFETMQ